MGKFTAKKSFAKSKTLWGVLIGIIGVLINQGMIDFMSTEELNQIVGLVGQLAGFGFTIYGRFAAKRKLH